MTDLDELQSTWHSLGKQNAKWAVLSDKKQWNNEEFFATGRREIKRVLAVLKAHGVVLPRQSRVMDFGSGVGRLSQALGKHFDEVVGVDIAESMVVEANRLNSMKNVSFKHVTSGDLKAFKDGSFDLVFTDIVFQHMENEYALRYMQDMYRILKKGGVLVFQLPSHPQNTWKGALIKALPDTVLTRLRKGMEMHPIPKRQVLQHLAKIGYEVIAVEHDSNHKHWDAYFYYVRK
jgi:ubiquinone/menaquinone biosynthesis C-methylase UbiE